MRLSISPAAVLALAASVMMPAPFLHALEIQPSEAFGFSFIHKMEHPRSPAVLEIELQEEDFEPNDWDGSVEPVFPPEGWGGDLGVLEEGTTVMHGSLRPTGFDNELGWYTGDTDLFGFNVPEDGFLTIDVQFDEECMQEQAYNVWFMAYGDMGNLWIFEFNFDYPYVDLGLVCPFITSYFLEPDFLLSPSGERAVSFHAFLAGASGPDTNYTLDLDFDDYSFCFFREALK
ncbi:hypothetical protein ACFL4G_03340 [Thermodesulfobacteriota bacterium]